METVLLVIQVLVCIALIGVILIQRSETDGFGLGSGSGMNMFSSRGQANFLTRTTAILATIFIINSLALSIIASRSNAPSIVNVIQEKETNKTPQVPLARDEAPASSADIPTSVPPLVPTPESTSTPTPAPDTTKAAPGVPVAE
ncbi:MAG: preprotein translocase subunit SecG [Alphaproteobacteria bacterium]|jgi:preprotein translocase subunit SecG